MTIDIVRAKSLQFAPLTVEVEHGSLRFFATTIGETDPVYLDTDAARAAGHRDVVVPATYLFSLGLQAQDPFGFLGELGVDALRVLHGEQAFVYHALAYAGDRLTLQDRIVDVYTKRDGTLEFLTKQTTVSRDGVDVAELRSVIVVRHPEVTTP